LANKQIVVIFLLIILTSGIQNNIGSDFFFRLFKKNMTAFQFRLRMMALVAGLSSMVNNTPIVAFMIPYVKGWANQAQLPASKFLIPLSFATILGGMITVVGTSTNLVLNGLIVKSELPPLGFRDFFYLGLLVTIAGIIVMAVLSDYLLPNLEDKKIQVIEHLNDYVIETIVAPYAPIIGKTVEEAGLRHLKEIFLVEIKRKDYTITAVGPNERIQEGDSLFFAGNVKEIFTMFLENKGLSLPDENYVKGNGYFNLTEAVVPSSSSLIGSNLRDCDFRNRYKGSVVSIYRQGEKVSGNLGEIKIQAGDLFLMLTGNDWKSNNNVRDLVVVTLMGNIVRGKSKFGNWPSILAILLLLFGVVGFLDLFIATCFGIFLLFAFKVVNLETIKRSLDIDLLAILVSSLAIGSAILNAGVADFIVSSILEFSPPNNTLFLIGILFLITVVLTSLITNAAAVSLMFPIALSMAKGLNASPIPFFVTIAFGASACFLTPFGYQTNLMVMGPGNYRFMDYFKIGAVTTFIYSIISVSFIYNFYF
jgi:di/tricarboxylate transporter